VISCDVISGLGPSGDVVSSNAIRKVPLLFAPPEIWLELYRYSPLIFGFRGWLTDVTWPKVTSREVTPQESEGRKWVIPLGVWFYLFEVLCSTSRVFSITFAFSLSLYRNLCCYLLNMCYEKRKEEKGQCNLYIEQVTSLDKCRVTFYWVT
jgi:hypothetical protein